MLGGVHANASATPTATPKKAASATADIAIAGRYFLSGVTEVGSELVLNVDGSFDWSFAYGNEDKFAEGRCERINDKIILTAKTDGAEEQGFTTMTLVTAGNHLVAPDFNNAHYIK